MNEKKEYQFSGMLTSCRKRALEIIKQVMVSSKSKGFPSRLIDTGIGGLTSYSCFLLPRDIYVQLSSRNTRLQVTCERARLYAKDISAEKREKASPAELCELLYPYPMKQAIALDFDKVKEKLLRLYPELKTKAWDYFLDKSNIASSVTTWQSIIFHSLVTTLGDLKWTREELIQLNINSRTILSFDYSIDQWIVAYFLKAVYDGKWDYDFLIQEINFSEVEYKS